MRSRHFQFFSLVGGSLADRLDRRKLMIACDAVRFAVMTIFAVTYALHVLTLPMIYSGLVDRVDLRGRASWAASRRVFPICSEKRKRPERWAVLIAAENG